MSDKRDLDPNRRRDLEIIANLVNPGDRVLEGIGPVIPPEEWAAFLPTRIPKLGEVAYATAYHWQGAFCHTEAGRK